MRPEGPLFLNSVSVLKNTIISITVVLNFSFFVISARSATLIPKPASVALPFMPTTFLLLFGFAFFSRSEICIQKKSIQLP